MEYLLLGYKLLGLRVYSKTKHSFLLGMSYPLEFREQVLRAGEEEKLSYTQAAKRFKVAVTTLVRWKKGKLPTGKRNRAPTKIKIEALILDIKRYPYAYQQERAKRMRVSKSGIYKALLRLGVTYRKTPSGSRRQTLLPATIGTKTCKEAWDG